MKIKVFSREQIEKFQADIPFVLISITDPNSEPISPLFDLNRKAILSLQFHDVDKKVKREDCKVCDGTGIMNDFLDINGGHCYACTDKMDIILFNEKDAESILDFVNVYKDEVGLIVVHCEAGISRSAGVAAALSLILNQDDNYYFKHYIPNMLVYRKILNSYFKNA